MKKIVIVLFFMFGLSFLAHYEKAEAYYRNGSYNRMSPLKYYAPLPIFISPSAPYPVTPTIPTPIVEPGYPTCKNPEPGISYITLNVYCTCPDGTIHGSNGGYTFCADTVPKAPPVPTPYVPYPTMNTQSINNNYGNSDCWNGCSTINTFQNNFRANSWQKTWNWY